MKVNVFSEFFPQGRPSLSPSCNQREKDEEERWKLIEFTLLSFTVQKAESDDGGSMLGSSKRSLAETSVTSTADLSIFSGGERRPASSQQFRNDNVFENSFTANEHLTMSDIDFNNEPIVGGDDAENGESSPK